MSNHTDTHPQTDVIRWGRRAPVFAAVPEWVIVAGLSPQALALYVALLAHVNHVREDGRVWPGMDSLCALLGFRHRNSVSRYVRELVAAGAIAVETRQHSTLRQNEYVVHELPAADHVGARSLAEFYTARKDAAAPPMHTVMGIGTHTRMGVAAHTTVGMNQTNTTTRSEQDEDAARGDDSVEDAFAAGGQRASSPTEIERARAKPKPITIRPPKGFLDADLDDGEIQRQLLACSVAALHRAGFQMTDAGKDKLLDGIRHSLRSVDRRDLVSRVQHTLSYVGTDDPAWGAIAVPRPRRAA